MALGAHAQPAGSRALAHHTFVSRAGPGTVLRCACAFAENDVHSSPRRAQTSRRHSVTKSSRDSMKCRVHCVLWPPWRPCTRCAWCPGGPRHRYFLDTNAISVRHPSTPQWLPDRPRRGPRLLQAGSQRNYLSEARRCGAPHRARLDRDQEPPVAPHVSVGTWLTHVPRLTRIHRAPLEGGAI